MIYGLQFIRPVNDIHLDFDVAKSNLPWTPPGLKEDHLTALVIAGDIWHARKYLSYANKSWLAARAQRFRYVIFVLGNHDYWGGAYNHEADRVKEEIQKQGLTNVFLLQDDTIDLEGVRFVGGTLWTDFNKQDPLTKMSWRTIMVADFKQIKKRIHYVAPDGTIKDNEYTSIAAVDLQKAHQKTKNYIFANAKKDPGIRKVVVVTHMAPSALSIDDRYKHDVIANGYYYSELGNEIADSEIDLWFHGHTHVPKDYMINNTRVVNNARGYAGYEFDIPFEPDMLIAL